jgi:hypothetical protein
MTHDTKYISGRAGGFKLESFVYKNMSVDSDFITYHFQLIVKGMYRQYSRHFVKIKYQPVTV